MSGECAESRSPEISDFVRKNRTQSGKIGQGAGDGDMIREDGQQQRKGLRGDAMEHAERGR